MLNAARKKGSYFFKIYFPSPPPTRRTHPSPLPPPPPPPPPPNQLLHNNWTTSENVHVDRLSEMCAQSDQNLHLAHSDRQECTGSSCVHRKLWSDCADTKTDLSLRWAPMLEYTFSHVATQLYILDIVVRCHIYPNVRTNTLPKQAYSNILKLYHQKLKIFK